ncbi:type II toxin-antitoxin system PemK/MazF family toxin [Puia sp.]|uniref:type II toxin-antitoxin system PemK/MazF family toxin n=1 Tax=Puia sp. TaxID=2045100 RepID=UPI0039C9C8D7
MRIGDIVLTTIPQDNQQKKRPVLILKILPRYNDLLVCAISSQVHQFVPNFDLELKISDAAFADTGLIKNSIVRLGSLAVLSTIDVIGTIGFLEKKLHRKLLQNLSDFLTA